MTTTVCMPLVSNAAYNADTHSSWDFENGKPGDCGGTLVKDPTNENNQVLKMDYVNGDNKSSIFRSATLDNGECKDLSIVSFDFYAEKLNTYTAPFLFKARLNNETSWRNIAYIESSGDDGLTASLTDVNRGATGFKLSNKKWYTIKISLDTANNKFSMYAGEKGEGLQLVSQTECTADGAPKGTAYIWQFNPIMNVSKDDIATTEVIHYIDNVTYSGYDSIGTAMSNLTNAADVSERLAFYASVGMINLCDESLVKDMNNVYAGLLNRTFASPDDVQSAYDALCEANKVYTPDTHQVWDFENGHNMARGGNIVADPANESNKVLQIPYQKAGEDNNPYLWFPETSDKNVKDLGVVSFDFYAEKLNDKPFYWGGRISGAWDQIGYIEASTSGNSASITDINRDATGCSISSKTWYTIKFAFDSSNKKFNMYVGEKGSEPKLICQTEYEGSVTKPFEGMIFYPILGFDDTAPTTDVKYYVDNITYSGYSTISEAMSNLTAVSDVSSALEFYSSAGMITLYDESQITDVDKVYEQLLNKTFSSADEVQTAYNSACDKYLIRDDYVVEFNSTKQDGSKAFNVNAGETFNADVKFTNNTDDAVGVVIISAFYDDDNCMIDITAPQAVSVPGDRTTKDIPLQVTVPDSDKISHMKQFVVDSYGKLTPFCKANKIGCVKPGYTPTLYLIGDSLCAEYGDEKYPYQGWGHYMAEHLNGVKVVNKGVAGWTTEHFVHPENKGIGTDDPYVWANIKNQLNPGDYVLVALGINDSGSGNIEEARYIENLGTMYEDTVNAGAEPLYSTPTIYGGAEGGTGKWEYSTRSSWARYGEICRLFAEDKGVACVPLGKTLTDTYNSMYDTYMSEHEGATAAEGLNSVRHYFHLYKSVLAEQFNMSQDAVDALLSAGDDVVHVNINGAQKVAEIMCSLIGESSCSLKTYIK